MHACFASWEVSVVSLLLCCRHCIIGVVPNIRIALIAHCHRLLEPLSGVKIR